MDPNSFRLLLVDDNESMRRVIRSVLTRLGMENVDEARDGVEALELYATTHYDLVVSDLYMPHMTGIELLRGIRALPGRTRTPVLIVSGQLSERNIREALEAGVDGFVAKPFVEGPLTERVTRLLLSPPRRHQAPGEENTRLQESFLGSTGHSGLA